MADFYLKKGDTGRPLETILSDANGPFDLTGLTVRFKMRLDRLLTPKVDAAAVPDADQTANKGKVKYEWTTDDVDSAGTFLGEFKVMVDGKPVSFPSGNNYIVIEIGEGVPDLPAEA